MNIKEEILKIASGTPFEWVNIIEVAKAIGKTKTQVLFACEELQREGSLNISRRTNSVHIKATNPESAATMPANNTAAPPAAATQATTDKPTPPATTHAAGNNPRRRQQPTPPATTHAAGKPTAPTPAKQESAELSLTLKAKGAIELQQGYNRITLDWPTIRRLHQLAQIMRGSK